MPKKFSLKLNENKNFVRNNYFQPWKLNTVFFDFLYV